MKNSLKFCNWSLKWLTVNDWRENLAREIVHTSTFPLAYKYISLHNLASLGSHIFKSGPVSLSMVQFCTHLFDTALQPFQRDRDRQSPEGWKPSGYTLLHCNSLIHKQCEFHNSSHRILPCSCRCNHVHCPYAGCILHHFCMAFSGMVACHLR